MFPQLRVQTSCKFGKHYENVRDVKGRVHDGVVDDALHRPAENTLLDLCQALAKLL